jgi:hypothetical protein
MVREVIEGDHDAIMRLRDEGAIASDVMYPLEAD